MSYFPALTSIFCVDISVCECERGGLGFQKKNEKVHFPPSHLIFSRRLTAVSNEKCEICDLIEWVFACCLLLPPDARLLA